MKIKAVIFDFDGVICESVEAKTRAIRRLFQNYPEHLEAIAKVHMDNGGMSRYRKFDIIYREILKKELSEKESLSLGEKFTDYSHEEVVKSDFVKGAREFLEKYYRELLLFVVSGTPEDEMISVVKEREIGHYFQDVYGSPRLKHDLANLILDQYSLSTEEVIFVGDSINDQKGADKAGIHFVGRLHKNYKNPFRKLSENQLIRDIDELEPLINKYYAAV